LSTLATPATTLGEVTKLLDTYLAKNENDKWARWLKGRAQLAAGQRKAAAATLKSLSEGDDGFVVAMIDLADMDVDDGNLDEAFKLYDKALAKQKDHPLAVMGRALARAENSIQTTDAIEDLNVKLDKTLGPRVSSYRYLALAMADVGIEDYGHSFEALKKATSSDKKPTESRFVARVAWALLERGQIDKPFTLLSAFPPNGSKAEDDPNSKLVEAGQLETRGMSSRALDAASKLVGPRAGLLRAYAYIDMTKGKDAGNEVDEVLKIAPDNLEAQILQAWARVLAAVEAKNDKDKTAAFDALEKLARKAKTKLGRHALGMAYFQTGDFKNAQPALEQALADITEDEPNPVAYRTRTALATILLTNNDADGAAKALNDALKANEQFIPALALKARFEMHNGDGDQALATLAPLLAETDLMTPEAKLTQAEALCNHKKPAVTPADKDNAEKILTELKDKVQPPTEVGRVAAACDPKWPEKLGVPVPPADGSKPATAPAGTTHHHHHSTP
jgi:tetratricopeptide (TPR) repeat protein